MTILFQFTSGELVRKIFERWHLTMKGHYGIILQAAENKVASLLRSQVMDRDSLYYGGFMDEEDRTINPGNTVEALLMLVPLYLNEDSAYHQDPMVYESILKALEYVERIQRPDGTFDLLISNFYSSPDTGFITHNLAHTYKVVEEYGRDEKSQEIAEKYFRIIKKSGQGMVTGGFHTPNHRWVIAAALMMAYNITKEEDFKDMAERYLKEGIDCDEDGEYTERSPGYNTVNNNALILLAEETEKMDLLDHVRRNLDMMLNYIEPDGTVFTQNSTRRDRGEGHLEQKLYPIRYYDLYLKMAYHFKDGRYATMADFVLESNAKAGQFPNMLHLFMIRPELKDFEIQKLPIPENYQRLYKDSGILRRRKGNMSYTLLKNSSNFLFLQIGDLRCYARLCASFFAVAQFKAQTLEEVLGGYKMDFKTHGFYRMPFQEAPNTSNWWEMDHNEREKTNELDLEFNVWVKEIEDGIEIRVTTKGCDRIPFKLEFCFTPNSVVEGEDFIIQGDAGGSLISKSGYIKVAKESDAIYLGPGFGEHAYASSMRGSEPQSLGDFTIYYTDYTPVDRVVTLRKA